MTTSTSTYTYTIAHTATYLSEVIMGEIGDLLATLGIVAHDAERWDLDQRAIIAWIAERSLKQVDLECHRPDGRVRPIFQFPIIYRAGHEGFDDSRAAAARARAKLSIVPSRTTYRLICWFHGAHSDQPGWHPSRGASTEGLRSSSYGVLADTPHARAELRVLR